ncbi:hypothetical protein CFK38_05015 [Brachybacterium vulturis]|uniref:WXG100 family type VII secretion target n=1 Tax=Brachybacterium vulturis TaxID=2017484 RepID=A0A291GKB3_9MICO|nr:hypothetical protein [Brachybacterium vulturis]ATG50963.1 hypothetical protein CFK38_05015 [Brachybacterium vulturis]
MSDFFGADTAALRDHAERVRAGSGRLADLRSQLAAQVSSVEWAGPDADAFRDDFTGRIAGLFTRATAELEARSGDLVQQAEEQDEASGSGGSVGGSGSAGGGGDRSFGDALSDFLANPLTGALGAGGAVVSAGGALWKGFKQWRNLRNLSTAIDTAGDAARSAQAFIRGGMIDDAAGFLGKLGTAGRFLGAAGGVLAIGTGIHDMIDPPHDGWRGVGDRVAGGLSVIGGAGGLAVALGAGAMLGPVGLGVVAAAGIGAGLWAAGNAIYDNWDSITGFFGDVGGAVGDFVGDAGDVVGEAADAVGDAIGDAAGAVGDFVGGIF